MPQSSPHISRRFDQDLTEASKLFLKMGQSTSEMVTFAMRALVEGDFALAEQVIAEDNAINQLEMLIDERILLLLAKRQPAARDLRLVVAISKGVVDIERIGDEAVKIAQMAQKVIMEAHSYCHQEVWQLSNQVRLMLNSALIAFESQDAQAAFSILQSACDVDFEYQSATRALMTYVMADARTISQVIHLMWVLRALERIGDHARNIAELIIYIRSGTDVRHSDFATVQSAIENSLTELQDAPENQPIVKQD